MRCAIIILAALGLGAVANADGSDCGHDPACVLDTLWPEEMEASPQEWRILGLTFVEAAQSTGDEDLTWLWVERSGWTPAPMDQPFGTARARDALATLTLAQLQDAWRERRAPWFNVARSDVMLALFRETTDPDLRRRLLADMLDFASPEDPDLAYEGREFADVLARIGLETCDAGLVRDGAALSGEPNRVRYKIWEAAARGRALDVALLGASTRDDFDRVLDAAEAYGSVWAIGGCDGVAD
jgi:hypothetical protein